MSVDSPQISDLALKFEVQKFKHFEVHYTVTGDDVVYHYWPGEDHDDFYPEFPADLEQAYKNLLPESADVRASYTDRREAVVLFRTGLAPSKHNETIARALPTCWVKVIGWANRPMADLFLKDRLFRELDKITKDQETS
jgi:hypothetical protein